MLPRDEVLRRLKMVRHSSYADRINGKSLTMSEIARCIGVARGYLYEMASEKTPIGPTTRQKLSDYFECQENGVVRADPRPAPNAAFSNGNGGFSLNFGSKMPRKA